MAGATPGKQIGDFKAAHAVRLETARNAPMHERLARLHVLCKQMSAIKSSAR
jgi:hypothetical protein